MSTQRHPLFARIFAERPEAYPHALEAQFARILDRIGELWGRPELSAYFEDLLLDRRGGRQGFPDQVARDIFRLNATYETMLRNGEVQDPWAYEPEIVAQEHQRFAGEFSRAVERNDVARMVELLDRGMPVDIRLRDGWTPLMIATFNSCEDAAMLLLKRGAKVTVSDADGYTPLHWASLNGFARAVPEILRRGGEVDATTRFGITALIQAASRGHVQVMRCLLDRGARANHQEHEGWTALHKAIANGHLEAALLLLSRGANAALAHRSGLTAADIARSSKRASMQRLFEPGAHGSRPRD